MDKTALNTDWFGILDEYFADGVPASSVRLNKLSEMEGPRSQVFLPTSVLERSWLNREAKEVFDSFGPAEASAFYAKNYDSTISLLQPELLGTVTPFLQHDDGSIGVDAVIYHRTDGVIFARTFHATGWDAAEVMGKPFSYFHRNVTRSNGDSVVPTVGKFVDHLIDSGESFERVGAFSFGKGVKPINAEGYRVFTDDWFVRFERQTIVSFPEQEAFLFLVKPIFVDVRSRPELILNAIENRHPECYYRDMLASPEGEELIEYLGGLVS